MSKKGKRIERFKRYKDKKCNRSKLKLTKPIIIKYICKIDFK